MVLDTLGFRTLGFELTIATLDLLAVALFAAVLGRLKNHALAKLNSPTAGNGTGTPFAEPGPQAVHGP